MVASTRSSVKKETPSFNNIFAKKKESRNKAPEKIATEERNEPVSQGGVQKKIKIYLKETKISRATKIVLSKPIKLNGIVIELGVSNSVEIAMIQAMEVGMMAYLKTELQNSFLELKCNITEDNQERKPYTNTEIFKSMVKKNPALIKLRDEFELDTDY